MLPRNHPDRIHVAFDDHRLVNNAGLILPATLALHLGLLSIFIVIDPTFSRSLTHPGSAVV